MKNGIKFLVYLLVLLGVMIFLGNAPLYASDSYPPQITSFSITPSMIDTTSSGKTVTVMMTLTDDQSGVCLSGDSCRGSSTSMYMISETSSQNATFNITRTSGNDLNGVYTATVVIPQGSSTGVWSAYLWLYDKMGSLQILDKSTFESKFGVGSASITNGTDVTPAQFIFTDQTNVQIGTVVTSNAITVSGINTPVNISIIGGLYSINGGNYTSASGTVNNGNTVTVQVTSSGSYSTKTDATLTIGGVSDIFSVTTEAPPDETPPDQFSFIDQTNVPLNTIVTSNEITVTGITSVADISITGGMYAINDGMYTEQTGVVHNGDTVTVQQTSSDNYSTTTNVTLTIGGVFDTFSITTKDKSSSGGGDGGGGGGCFIATAAFGSSMAGQVEILRQFRDKYLLTNAPGKRFVAWYYRNGPVAAKWINDKPVVKAAVRVALYPLIGFSFLLISGHLPFLIIGLLLSTLLLLRFRPEKISEI